MKTPLLLGVVASVVSCQLDKLLTAGEGPPSDAPPVRVVFRDVPGTAQAGRPITPAVRVALEDSSGRLTVRDTTVALRLAANPSGDRLLGDTVQRSVDGVATFANVLLRKAASGYTLTAASPELLPDTSGTFNVMPGPATALTFTVQPSGAPADSAITPPVEVTVLDAFENKANNFGGMVRIALGRDGSASGKAKLTGKTVASPTAGVARFPDLRIDRAGTDYTLSAAFASGAGGGGAPAVESRRFDVRPTATRLEVITQPPTAVLHSEPFQVQVAAVDIESHIVSSFTGLVSIVIANDGSPSKQARLGGATQAVVVNGIATFSDLTIDRAGAAYTLRATTRDLTGATTEALNVL